MENKVQSEGQEIRVDENKLNRYMEGLRLEQNFSGAIIGGVIGAVIGAALWAVITIVTEYQIGYMAIGVGFITGLLVRKMGKGLDQVFGVIGAAFALFGCFIGNYLSIAGLGAKIENISFVELALNESELIMQVMAEDFGVFDILFYGLALYTGYKYAFRDISDEEVMEAAGIQAEPATEEVSSEEDNPKTLA
ncbi:hypothetical protein AB9P05_16965 [Roseivirga sp. BDSF3-8]|uniref:hypothetical protein n=1 Tax=Roseivirga sp. BDSF3-8 TaxID=3241598 RepID=UPI0035318A86